MKLKVLGCSGGIGGAKERSTSFLVDDDVLIDCGTGVGDLEREALLGVDHVFLTHSHMDHIACLPMLIDSVGEARGMPITVYATTETLRIVHSHIFNWLVWPDFTTIPDRARPFLNFRPISVGTTVDLGGRYVTALPAHHTVPAVGYLLDSGSGKLVFSGDTAYCEDQIDAINRLGELRHLIIETAFPDEQHGLATASRHLCPSLLKAVLDQLTVSPQVHISHLKPGSGERIMQQIFAQNQRFSPRALASGDVLVF